MAPSHADPPADSVSDALAPSSLPFYVDRPLSILVNIGFVFVVLPPTLLYNVATYFTLGPPLESWDLKTLLVTRCLKAYLAALFYFGLPGHDRDAARIPKGMVHKEAFVQLEMLPPAAAQRRIGWAVCPAVPSVQVPSFMVWQKASKQAKRAVGTEKAGPDEKIIMYFVGGGYISGHPLRSHLIWSISRWLDTRILGRCRVRGARIDAQLMLSPPRRQLPQVARLRVGFSGVLDRCARGVDLSDGDARVQASCTSRT